MVTFTSSNLTCNNQHIHNIYLQWQQYNYSGSSIATFTPQQWWHLLAVSLHIITCRYLHNMRNECQLQNYENEKQSGKHMYVLKDEFVFLFPYCQKLSYKVAQMVNISQNKIWAIWALRKTVFINSWLYNILSTKICGTGDYTTKSHQWNWVTYIWVFTW